MEDLHAQEQAAYRHVHELLKDKAQPIYTLVHGYDEYRRMWLINTFADFGKAEQRQSQLWDLHQAGRKYFRDDLTPLRAQGSAKAVQARQLAKLYKHWIKGAVIFYRAYIHQLNANFGGIPELQMVAHQMNTDTAGESSQMSFSPEAQKIILACCHQTLIYLGDLSRYRATEHLDSKQDFGPAIGYYGLASTLRPSSGLGFHQQAVVELERKDHLKSVYYLYRAVVVEEPHPVAAKNLKLEFGKVNSAWEKGELIPKTAPNDPEAPKNILAGWFVRMHSMCAKGEIFSSHAELEREVLSQLAAVVKKEGAMTQATLMRMVMVNLAAQYHSGLLFQANPENKYQQAFFYFFRLNIKTYTAFLKLFYDTLHDLPTDTKEGEELPAKLTPLARRLLPALRLYSSWLTANVHLAAGLSSDPFLADSINALWATFARAVDVLADKDVFGVWNLDEYDAAYMLEEDADTIGFQPLQDAQQKVWTNWLTKSNGTLKPRFSDAGVARMSEDDEMLARVKGLLEDGSFLAHEVKDAPLGIVGDRIYFGQALTNALAAAEEAKNRPPEAPKQQQRPAPLSYAAAARSGQTVGTARPRSTNGEAGTTSSRARHAQMAQMVDNVVDEDDGNAPVTPPQQHVAHPAVVTNGDGPYNGLPYAAQGEYTVPSYQPKMPTWRHSQTPQAAATRTPPAVRTPKEALTANTVERLQSVSKLWDDIHTTAPSQSTSPSGFPSGLPTGTLSSPPHLLTRIPKHSRGDSASSIRSRASQNLAGSWSSVESAGRGGVQQQQQGQLNGLGTVVTTPTGGYSKFSASEVASPLLFGAGGGIWSTGAGQGQGMYRDTSPTGGMGG